MASLYELSADMAALEQILIETGGDLSDPAAEAAITQWEAELSESLTGKIDGYICLIHEIEARAEARHNECRRLQMLADADEMAARSLRERLRWNFEVRNLKPIQTDRFRVALVKNGGKQPLEIIGLLDDLPDWAVRKEIVRKPDTDAIRDRLAAGENLSFAYLKERGNRISIK